MFNKKSDQYMTSIDTELLLAIVESLENILDVHLLGNAKFELECELNEYIPFCSIMGKACIL